MKSLFDLIRKSTTVKIFNILRSNHRDKRKGWKMLDPSSSSPIPLLSHINEALEISRKWSVFVCISIYA